MVVGVQGDHNLGTERVQLEMLRAQNKTVQQVGGCGPEGTPEDTPPGQGYAAHASNPFLERVPG